MPDHDPFTPNRVLLNPKFSSYKLQPSATPTTFLYPLPTPGLHLRPLPDHARLAYAEVQERVRHNHLSTGLAGEVVYVNGELQVIAVQLDQNAVPTFHLLAELPQPVFASSSTAVFEYPTALPISPFRWAVSDGSGLLHILQVSKTDLKWSGTIERTYELVTDHEAAGGELMPFRLHSVGVPRAGKLLALLSTTVKVSQGPLPKFPGPGGLGEVNRVKLPSTTEFDYRCVELVGMDDALSGHGTTQATTELHLRWKVRSHDLPSFVKFLPESSTYLIGAPTAPVSDISVPSSSIQPPASNLTSTPIDATPRSPTPLPSGPKPPPFHWVQDTDSLTVAFAVPSDTPTSSIRVTFSRLFLSLLIGSASSLLSSSATPVPRVSHKKFWDSIDPHSSVWTFDREAEGRDSSYGVLSLHLEKANPGTRWPDLFATSSGEEVSEAERELEGVMETVDPSELAKISESMEQWTQGVPGGVGADNEGLGQGVPTSLTGEEMDVEVDGDTGRQCVFTWVTDVEGQPPKIVRPHPSFHSSLLSTPLPVSPPPIPSVSSIVIKNDVDGLAFTPPSSSASSWTHTTTFPALSFVLATKRDASFVYHLGETAVFAFDSPSSPSLSQAGQGLGSSGNLFVYFKPEGTRDPVGRQLVLRIGGPGSGALLGVAGVVLEGGATVMLALCENELVLYRIL
ncbi:hypothetical protein P7C70_g6207, partial [Phenoliferia sp. Uapishka_3]